MKNNIELEQQNNSQHSHKTDLRRTKTQKPKKNTSAEEEETVLFRELFRFATKSDWAYIILGSIFSAINGAAMPLFCLIWGDVMDGFTPAHGYDALIDVAGKVSIKFIVVGAGSFIASYLGFALWMITGERQAIEIRKRYFKAFLTQEISFFDSINPNELSTKMAEECFNIQGGIGEKVSTFIYAISMMLVAFIIGFVKGWQLALVLTGFLPVMIITGSLFVFVIQRAAQINNQAYNKAGAIAEEALNAIKTVVSLGGQAKELNKYKLALEDNKRAVMKFIIFGGLAIGAMMMSVFLLYALGFFVGSIFIADEVISPESGDPYTAGDVFVIFFCILNASSTLGQVSPALKAFSAAKIAATKVFKIIDKRSKISIEDPAGLKPSLIDGDIHFRNVSFAYPLKPDRKILNEISFDIKKNEKTAFVGESGCGKTTCMQLIERFYDIDSGSITLDNSELKELNLKWMRENIGYVGQEPVLFATSIKENILMAKEDASDDEIWAALKKANSYDFVQSLPKKLDTFVGTNGAQLSGGQKQRLAIARAILKDPKILLLDEATSALDRKNEMEIQKTLDEISEGRTTIVIAHRLATVQNSDHIIVFDQGRVVEEGRHEELIAKKGKYYSLQHLQLQTVEQEAQQETHTETETLKPVKINPKATLPIDKTERNPEKIEVTVYNGETNPALNKQKDKKDAETKKIEKEVLKRLFKYNKGQMSLMIVSFIVASANGCIFPVLALLNSTMVDIFTNPDAPDFRRRSNTMSLVYLIIAIAAFLINGAQSMLFNILGENLSRKVRTEVFEKYIKMPIGWFDKPENSPGALCSKLSTDATLINTLTSSVIGYIIQALAAFICGMIISFTASWQLTLISLGLSPLMILAGKMQSKFSQGFSAQNDEAFKESAAFVAEAMNNMRTVASFGREQKIMENYSKKLDGPLKASLKRGHLSGFFFGVSQLVFFGIYAITLYLGAIFMRDIGLDLQSMLQSIFGVMFAAMGVGNAMQFIPDLGSAINAAIGVFKILDTEPEINIDDPHQNVKTPVMGNIEFRNVSFKYPSREKQIFNNLSFKINASTKVAFVGPSGCGKSTILALLQRFYDPSEGQILIDGVDIKKYDLKYLRSCFGVVSQEPVLFNGSIEYNIRYARDEASFEEVKQAAAEANALGFIINNEFDVIGDEGGSTKYGTGFQRLVGPKGSQLSGGQKQRIAIARAILKNPSVLILDEATSALDSQNEKIVQLSLDKIMEGKTSVVVAHRISTIRDADEILVFNEGEIVERGSYGELVQAQGTFYKLERGMGLTS